MLSGGGHLNLISSVWLKHYYLTLPIPLQPAQAPLTFFLLMTLLHPAQPESFFVVLLHGAMPPALPQMSPPWLTALLSFSPHDCTPRDPHSQEPPACLLLRISNKPCLLWQVIGTPLVCPEQAPGGVRGRRMHGSDWKWNSV